MNTTKTDFIKTIKYDVDNPDNIRLYHGTTHAGGKNIPIFGFSINMFTAWNCSCEEYVYFYELNEWAEVNGYEEDSFRAKQISCIEQAAQSGMIQEALLHKQDDYVCVLEFILPPEIKEYLQADDSCEHMDGAFQLDIWIINNLIAEDKCTINVYKYGFAPKCSLLYITGLQDNPYFDAEDALSQTEQEMLMAFSQSHINIPYEDLFCNFKGFMNYYGSQFDQKCYRD